MLMFWSCKNCEKLLEENKELKEKNKELNDAKYNLVLIANKSWKDHCYDEEKYKQYQQDNIDLMNKISELRAELYDLKKQQFDQKS